jgi:hypothetical protein
MGVTSDSKQVYSEEYYLLGYNTMKSVESQATFRRNISPPSSRSKNKPSKKQAWKLGGISEYTGTGGKWNSVPVGSPIGQNETPNTHWLSRANQ